MGNCLVTKLKATVDNSDLITLGKVILTLPTVEGNVDESLRLFYIEGNNIGVKVDGDFVIWINGVQYTEFNTTSFSGSANGIISSLSGGKIIIDAYNVTKLKIPGIDVNGISQLFVTDTFKAFFNGMTQTYGITKEILKHGKGMSYLYDTRGGTAGLGLDDSIIEGFIERNPNMVTLCIRQSIPASAMANSLIQETAMAKGDIADMPATIKKFAVSSLTGSLTALIAKFRAAGRTSGKITIGNILTTVAITVDNGSGQEITCAQWAINNNIPQVADGYVEWTVDSIALTNSGTGAESVPTFNNV